MMLRKILLPLLVAALSIPLTLQAKDGYKITVNLQGAPDSQAFLAHYYGKNLPTIYKTDSATFKNGVATFESKEKILSGIYIVMLSDKKNYFEMLLNNGDVFEVSGVKDQLPQTIKFKGSEENNRFLDYMEFLKNYGNAMQAIQTKIKDKKKSSDTAGVGASLEVLQNSLTAYRTNYVKKYPGTTLAAIFSALQTPIIPKGKHFLEDGKTEDTLFAYKYYKAHYWDGFDFQDDRLIHTPLYDAKLEEYFNKVVYPLPDSVIADGVKLLAKTKGTKELFKYTLFWLQKNARASNVMGMDEVFVYFVENYYMKGDAYWLTDKEVAEYADRAQKIKPNVIGNIAPLLLAKKMNGEDFNLSDVKADYTMLVFWSPTCGHCLTETPKIDSVYRLLKKKYNVAMVGFKTESNDSTWKSIIQKEKIDDWIHVSDPLRETNYKANYDIVATPVLYLLDQNKKIVGKKLDHSNVASVVENLEKRKRNP